MQMSDIDASPPIVVVDLETTGLNGNRHEILQIAAIKVDWSMEHTLAHMNVRVMPQHIRTMSDEARKISGYDPDVWAKHAIPRREALLQLKQLADGAVFAGKNVDFDLHFIEVACGNDDVFIHPHAYPYRGPMELWSMARCLLDAGVLERLSLNGICKALGVELKRKSDGPHDAWDDAVATLRCLRRVRAIHSMGVAEWVNNDKQWPKVTRGAA